MEVKINREIRNYTESMFFGLSLRQFIFSVLALGVAVLLYFVLKPYLGTETVSWVCILGAAPFAAMGFITYHGMTAEQFLWAWLRSEFIEPRFLRSEPVNNIYYETMKGIVESQQTVDIPLPLIDLSILTQHGSSSRALVAPGERDRNIVGK